MKSEEVRMSELLFVIFLYIVFDVDKFLNALTGTETAHVFLEIAVLTLVLLDFGGAVVRENPRKDEVLIEIAIGAATEYI